MWWRRSRIVYIDVRWMFVKILAAVMIFIALTSYWKWTRVTVIEFEAPEMEAAWKVSDNKVIAAVKKGIGEPVNSQTTPPVKGVIIMKLVSIRETRQYLFTEPGQVFDPKNNVMLQTKDSLNEILRRAVVELRSRSPFGEIIIWDEVDNILQIGDKATVIDLDSGENFKVRRTGGISHARVEPLTGNDSTAARKVYGGKWSWKRRAVVVETRGRKIAASLTGMPQGKGELTDNDCYGSLGLYFAGESTEKSPNISHLVMIWKAAGKTGEMLTQLSPEKTLLVLFTALDQQDLKTLEKITGPLENGERKLIGEVIGVTIRQLRKKSEQTYALTVSVSMKNGPYNYPRHVTIKVGEDPRQGINTIEKDFLEKLLGQ